MPRLRDYGFVSLVVGFLLSSGCASLLGPVMLDGIATPRLNLEFVGNPYSIKHTGAHPRPGNPSGGVKGPGGSIFGSVCGADIQYDVTHYPDRVKVNGFLDNQHSATLEIREANNIRRIQGSLGVSARPSPSPPAREIMRTKRGGSNCHSARDTKSAAAARPGATAASGG
jgi:hypothetical protein